MATSIHERGDGVPATLLRKKADPAQEWADGLPEVAEGETVTVLRVEGAFSLVRLASGVEGFVRSKYIRAQVSGSAQSRTPCRALKAIGHPVHGGGPKPTLLTSEPLLPGHSYALELRVAAKQRELRVGVVNRPEYLRVVASSGGARSFYSSAVVDAVAHLTCWQSGAALLFGDQVQEHIAGVTVSAGDAVRVELDRSDESKTPRMRAFVNSKRVCAISLPPTYQHLCFGVQLFDHADEVVVVNEPAAFAHEVNVDWTTRQVRSTGRPVHGGGPKPTLLTSEPLLPGHSYALELRVAAKQRELRVGVVNRPEYLRVVASSGGARSFYSSAVVDAVAHLTCWQRGSRLLLGNAHQEELPGVTVSAGDAVRVELDCTGVSRALEAINGAHGTSLAPSFVLEAGTSNVVLGNMKHSVGQTLLRDKPTHDKGSNFNGSAVRDGELVVVRELADRNEFALIEAGQGSKRGWVKVRNLHVQLVRPTQQHVGKLAKGFFVLQPGQRAVVGNTLHDCETLLRRRGVDEKDFNGASVRNSEQIVVLETCGDFARIKAVNHAAEGWIKLRNLHVQMMEPEMRVLVNGNRVCAMSLPASWSDLCFGVQFFDHGDEVAIVSEPEPFVFELNVEDEEPGCAAVRHPQIENAEARQFWGKHFHQMTAVSWRMLAAALASQFGLDQSQLSRLEPKLNVDSHGNISKREFHTFTAKTGLQESLDALFVEKVSRCVVCDEETLASSGVWCQGSSILGSVGNPPHVLCSACVGVHVKTACQLGGSFEKRDGSPGGSIPCCLFPQDCNDGALSTRYSDLHFL